MSKHDDQEKTPDSFKVIALKCIIYCILLTCIGKFLIEPCGLLGETLKSVVLSLLATFETVLIANVLWELIAKKRFADYVYNLAQISVNFRESGVELINRDFGVGIDWENVLKNANQLTVVFTYGGSWRGTHKGILKDFIQKHPGMMKIYVPDYRKTDLMSEFDRRFRYKSGVTASKIESCVEDFQSWGANVYLVDGSLQASYYLTDKEAYMSFFRHFSKYGDTVPVIKANKDGWYYDYIKSEIDAISEYSTELSIIKPSQEANETEIKTETSVEQDN